MLKANPKLLVGSEMIFVITTSLQDLLDQAAQYNDQDVPALDEERAKQQAIVTEQAQKEQEEKHKEMYQASIDEEQYLADMVANQKTREERRREKLQLGTSKDPDVSPGTLSC